MYVTAAVRSMLKCVPQPNDPDLLEYAQEYFEIFLDAAKGGIWDFHTIQVISCPDEQIFETIAKLLYRLPLRERRKAIVLAVDVALAFANEFRSDDGRRDVWVSDFVSSFKAWNNRMRRVRTRVPVATHAGSTAFERHAA
ncbi:MAG: hypothetical protein WD066_08480 [Planctomycetaceae bacterium]